MQDSFGQIVPPAGAYSPVPDPAPDRDRTFLGRLSMAEWLLKHRDFLIDQIEAGRGLPLILIDLVLVTVLPTMFYGLVMGLATGSAVRIVSNPIKLPLVLLFTLCLCLPTLYIFSSYLGSRRRFLSTSALAFTGVAIMGVILAAFAPITWFLTFTAPHAYPLHVLVNVAVLGLAGSMGVAFLMHGTRRVHRDSPHLQQQIIFLWCWIALFGLVGAEMGYLLRPFFSPTAEWLRARTPHDETVFQAIWSLMRQLFR